MPANSEAVVAREQTSRGLGPAGDFAWPARSYVGVGLGGSIVGLGVGGTGVSLAGGRGVTVGTGGSVGGGAEEYFWQSLVPRVRW